LETYLPREVKERFTLGNRGKIDPNQPIAEGRVTEAARALKISEAEVRSHYETLADDLMLKLDWKS